MSIATILTVLRKELRDHLRDRRTALMVFTLSIVMGPLILVGLTYFVSSVEEKAEKREVYVQGVENSPQLVNFFARQDVTIKDPKPDFRELIKQGKHDAVLVIPKDFQQKFVSGKAEVELVYDDTRQDTGGGAGGVLRRLLRAFNGEVTVQRLIARGVSPQVMRAVEVQDVNMGTPAQRAAMLLFIIPWMALIVGVTGCVAVAIDMTAGERERGSLEPLLMNPVSRSAVIIGKWGAVAVYGIVIVTLILLGFGLTLAFAPMPKLAGVISLSPAQYLLFAAMLFPFAPAIGALQMLIATYGRTFKEAQTYVSYLVSGLSLVPVVSMFGQFKDAVWQLFVPMLGQLMVLTRILRGEPVQAIHFLLPMGICVLIAVVSIALLTHLLQRESIIFGRS
ncbi:MAG TPA: ABC transporter permease [Usitatibacteraceae bacterium]